MASDLITSNHCADRLVRKVCSGTLNKQWHCQLYVDVTGSSSALPLKWLHVRQQILPDNCTS